MPLTEKQTAWYVQQIEKLDPSHQIVQVDVDNAVVIRCSLHRPILLRCAVASQSIHRYLSLLLGYVAQLN